ncbi:S26 family signal peptidase [Streptomyces filamentosus]|uniref:S26 family signal peptidase n=1 Tax=Streptomyces filamentosus TaxID=67294 RepID=UPI00123AABD3|nr:S26 family signal peptidase [Streptomyces filamentosus]KAA6218875.1 S26 family signal peptidase [Streptomyces filamentosus]
MYAFLGAVAVLVLALLLLRLLLSRLRINGPSMMPALRDGQRVLVVRSGPARLRTGRIVVVAPPEGLVRPRRDGAARPPLVVKRIAALAGDPVPPEVCGAAGVPEGTLVPPGRVALLGDNPAFSTDSRFWGLLPVSSVVGVVLDKAA